MLDLRPVATSQSCLVFTTLDHSEGGLKLAPGLPRFFPNICESGQHFEFSLQLVKNGAFVLFDFWILGFWFSKGKFNILVDIMSFK